MNDISLLSQRYNLMAVSINTNDKGVPATSLKNEYSLIAISL